MQLKENEKYILKEIIL